MKKRALVVALLALAAVIIAAIVWYWLDGIPGEPVRVGSKEIVIPGASEEPGTPVSDVEPRETEGVDEPGMISGGVEYPKTGTTNLSWGDKDADGYVVTTEVVVWEPVRLDQDYVHPADSSLTILMDTSRAEDAWILPFSVVVENETTGFGAAQYAIFANVSQYSSDSGWRDGGNSPLQYGGLLMNHRSRGSYDGTTGGGLWVFTFDQGVAGLLDGDEYHHGELGGGQRTRISGYVLLEEAERTPNRPNGLALPTENHSGPCEFTFLVSRQVSGNHYQPVVGIVKDASGNVVFGKGHEAVDVQAFIDARTK